MSEVELIAAVRALDYDKVAQLLRNGSNVDEQDDQGWTALSWASGLGNLSLAHQLIEHGADVFNRGKDQRTPYLIALAAGRADVSRFLRDEEERRGGDLEGLSSRQHEHRPHCCAYVLSELRAFPEWREKQPDETEASASEQLPDDAIVFLHRDFTVTQTIWPNEQVVFDEDTPEWRAFCTDKLNFHPLDDFDWLEENTNT
jgi:uncharacterized protein